MENTTIILVVMIVYMFLLIGWGLYQGRKVKTASDFAIAGRKLPGWVAALSERATGESSWALLGLPGAAYATGLMEVWTAIGCVVGIIVAWVVIAKRLQREADKYEADTFTGYIAKRHGNAAKWIRLVGSATIVFFFFFYVGAQFLGGGKTLNSLFEIDRNWAMLLVVLLVVPYTIYGGFRSVTYTDVIQSVLMIITLIITPIAGYFYLKGITADVNFASSVGAALEKAGPEYSTMMGGAVVNPESALGKVLTDWFPNAPDMIAGLGSGIMIAVAFSWFFGYLGGQPQLSMRFMAIRSAKEAKVARNIGVIWTVIAYTGALYIGWLGIAIFGPEGLADQETVMPRVLTTIFPPVISGILITGVLAAIISTANSLLILSATELSENLIKPLSKNKSEAQSLLQSRAITAALSVIALLIAFVTPSDLIYSIVGYVWAGIGSTFSVVILLTLFYKSYHGKAALATMIAGLVFTLFWIGSGLDAVISSRIMTFVVALIVALLSTKLLKPTTA
ncbi:sodium/proline symporter [Gilvibacter sediminis]|uniref:sodium/proline symporter n=1 Tax=Gilvibacter sediminis TaxID=379071 RepID=UPI0023508148|nr:sodium/proline symporter [Gilvibacter sediminis]MDC7996632.1 sodium/proline symporter [Gilvibacter sediminis]